MNVKYLIIFLFVSLAACTGLEKEIRDTGNEMTVLRAKDEIQDYNVTLTGKIVKKSGDGYYIFQDPTDEIKIYIENSNSNQMPIEIGKNVKISGKVDKAITGIQINVNKIEPLTE